jgi:hypothetical protein
MGLAAGVLLEIIKQPESWKTGKGAILYLIVMALCLVAQLDALYKAFTAIPYHRHQELKQFLQWAELDTKEEYPDPIAKEIALQRHFSALNKFTHGESRVCGRRRHGKEVL